MPTRLLITPPAAGDWNMAVDEHLLLAAADGAGACLRFYQWSPATLSLGYFQAAAERKEHAASRTCPLVRRASGGGAIVHDRELTYSFVVPVADRWSAAAEKLYALFHETLIDTLAESGVTTRLQGVADSHHPAPFLCFQRRSPLDVVVGEGQENAKIVGSAQRRVRGAILQHGSILLARSSFAPELPGLAELGGPATTAEELATAWLPRLMERLGVGMRHEELRPEELGSIQRLAEQKFAHCEWIGRR